MTLKTPKKFLSLERNEVPEINRTFGRLFQSKKESLWLREGTEINPYSYQSEEHGIVDYSGTGSPTVAQTFSLKEKQNKIIHAIAHAHSTLVTAHVTDVTQTAITIECRTISGTANFSDVTTATIKVHFKVQGSNP